ncbi:uncharacterized protein M6B38_208500 [Iris pallida]|uniref:Uncharacterized protein n=1 Tax=Iris pallida TaxID=29817 RepID=A0AAX6E6B7_IRIPA|nr:uncharacterized protein M6B38_208500 [Iris pallida]
MALGTSHKRRIKTLDGHSEHHMNVNWEDVICPICLDFPHNGVLLKCSSYDKGCRPFMCDTDHTHSNCLDRFKTAYGVHATITMPASAANGTYGGITQGILLSPNNRPTCPLCRGVVSGWTVIDEARTHLNSKKRCCEERQCSFSGNYAELQVHTKQSHPNARPSEIDPARKLDWEHFQQSSEIIDVLSTIQSEVPHGVVLGDYVIEYGGDSGDESEDFHGDGGNWWTSCILYQVFDNFRASRNRRRSRARDSSRDQHISGYDASNIDEGSTSSLEFGEYQFDDPDDEFIGTGSGSAVSDSGSRGTSSYRSYRRRRSRFHDP